MKTLNREATLRILLRLHHADVDDPVGHAIEQVQALPEPERVTKLEVLLGTVGEMRKRQKAYFQGRRIDDMQAAKLLEHDVDRMVSELEARQGRLL